MAVHEKVNDPDSLADRFFAKIFLAEQQKMLGYPMAIGLSLLALYIRLLIAPAEAGLQFVTFFPAVSLTAVLFGIGPGLLATAFCAVMASYFFFPPLHAFIFDFEPKVVWALVVFCTDGFIVSFSVGALQRYYRKVLATMVDISEYKRNVEELHALAQSYQAILDSTNFSIISTNPEGVIQTFNQSAERMLGYSAEEMEGKQTPAIFHDLNEVVARAKALSEELDTVIEPGFNAFVAKARLLRVPDEQEWTYIRKDGTRFPVLLSITSLWDRQDKVAAYLGVAIDITERRRAQEHQLVMMQELTRVNGEMNNFVYIASHDLKSPLRGIDQLATWITEDMGDQINAETQDHLRLLRSRIHRMEMLLDDLLAYSRSGRSDDEVVTINTHDLVEDIFELNASHKAIHLHLDENLPTLHTQKVPLELVFRNLISNAIKHHDKSQGTIEISARPIADGFEFSVKDDGPGIPLEHQERVFAMFQTLKPKDEVEGTGLGLALIKKTVESVGGQVTLESDGKHGCTFRFSWPTVFKKSIFNATSDKI